VRRLGAAGAIPIGKTAMDPLGWETRGQAPGHPPCLNPVDASLSPGGSSAGSAVAVAAGIAALGLGTDTAGSIRIPAAYCGIVGLKPAARAFPRRGAIVVAPSFDTPGILARSVRDCELAHQALTGRAIARARGSLRVALLEDLLEEADPGPAGSCERAMRRLVAARGSRPAVELGAARLGWRAPGFGRILAVELARTWGDRIERDPDRFPAAIRRSCEHGRRTEDAAYERTRREMTRARRSLAARLAGFDAVVCPTVPSPVPLRDAQEVETSIRFTRSFSALGWPAISVPLEPDGRQRPVGLQVAAVPARLPGMLALAAALEAVVADSG
jgi:aspartyl-tRNA(Asn)/glutamyl-tRNA(Gln) amidotransferase subunit A